MTDEDIANVFVQAAEQATRFKATGDVYMEKLMDSLINAIDQLRNERDTGIMFDALQFQLNKKRRMHT